MKSLVLLLPLSLLLIAGCEVGGPPSGSVQVETISKRPGLQEAEPKRSVVGNGVGNELQQRDIAAAPPQPASEPAVPDDLADACSLKIKLVSETVTLPRGRRHILRSCVLRRSEGRTKYLEISPNGRYLLLGVLIKGPNLDFGPNEPPPDCGRVFLIDMREGKLVKTLKTGRNFYYNHNHRGDQSYNCGVVFSPDSSYLASILHDDEIEVLGIGPGAKSLPLQDAKGPTPRWVRWSPDGSLLACVREDETVDPARTYVDVWDGRTGKKLYRLEEWRFVFTSDGRTILTHGDLDRLWDARTGKMIGIGRDTWWLDLNGVRVRRSPAARLAVFWRFPCWPYVLKDEKEARIILLGKKTGKEIMTVTAPKHDWRTHGADLYPPRKSLVTNDYPSQNFLIAWASGEPFGRSWSTTQVWDLSGLPGERIDEATK